MIFDKYKGILLKKMKDQLTSWFDNNEITLIENRDVYRFLHSIKGTSGTLELDMLYGIASELLAKVENRKDSWSIQELRDFLSGLMEISYEYEHFHEEIGKPPALREGDAPLIQIIDDDISLLIFLKDKLESKGWMVIANTTADKAIEQYYNMHPDCIIIDINLQDQSGYDVLSVIQNHTNRAFIPKIMCSIKTDRDSRIEAYRNGADDFMEKPIDVEEFLIRVERHLERKKIFDQSVLIDELTQVYNRKFLKDSYNRFISDMGRLNANGTIAVIDIDYFKRVNDTYGHIVGDKVLMEFAQFLKKSIRSTDTLFRYGGEEFVILFQRATETEIKDVLERMLDKFSQVEFTDGEKTFSLTFSAGVYRIENTEIGLQAAIKTADEALYLAKENGRARVETANKRIISKATKLLNVSIVDDDTLIRSILINIFSSLELDNITLDVKAYEDGMQFLDSDRLAQNGIHFLVLDGIMPVMDGLEILQIVKKSQYRNNVNVLMLTGRKSENDIAEALKLGADDYVTKPFSLTELQARIVRLIKRMV
ncbi:MULTISPECIES: GGDEF domain-containing response regulator [Bacillaceae]|uniref:GGDEF domain-containing response regulator n=2 Tax=Bacillales TaxID=1385 RepID=UPI001E31C97A|nr:MULTISPECIES: diguanylate cyclase [Bacillaceae]MCE4051125.1 diguanylate cyclase [Bacillus sp. Au-Bac7]MDL0436849.1 diguanylate cyclase [Niallia sp. SS-2023]